MRLICTRYMSGAPLTEWQNMSISRDGLPNRLGGIGKSVFRQNKTWGIRIILTLLSVGRLFPGDGSLSTATITSPWTGSIPRDLLRFSQ